MILSSADSVKVGNTEVSSVRVGSVEIWSAEDALFNFTSRAGVKITLKLGVTETVTVDWGDGSSDDYILGTSSTNHEY